MACPSGMRGATHHIGGDRAGDVWIWITMRISCKWNGKKVAVFCEYLMNIWLQAFVCAVAVGLIRSCPHKKQH